MAVLLGNNLIIKVNGTAIAGAKSCEINIQCGEIEIADVSQSQWRQFIAGRKDWTVSCNHLIPRSGTPLKSNAAMIATTVTLTMQTGLSGDTLTGTAIVKQWNVKGAVASLANGSFSFRGSGALG